MEFGVGFAVIVLTIFSSFTVAQSSTCAGTKCLKSGFLYSNAKSKEGAVASMSHHGNDNTDNAVDSMGIGNEAMSRKSRKVKESKEFESQDYRSYNPSPSFRQPSHKLTPNL
ncbi:hypothetical protein SUGI_1037610 [Cryptomeria japonica]|nr:hypothetical protein SUGI_1037610 [Cryptomeria japonica]